MEKVKQMKMHDLVVLLCGVIEASAIIIASVSVYFLSSSLQRKYKTSFSSYGNEDHNIDDLIRRANNEIYIIANCGDTLFKDHKNTFIKCLKRGVKINALILDKNTFPAMDRYVSGTGLLNKVKISLQILNEFKNEYKNQITLRESSEIFTQSYICIDIDKPTPIDEWSRNCIIQVMLYQFMTPTKKSAIAYFYPAKDEKEFGTTVKSIHQLWNNSKELKVEEYINFIDSRELDYFEA